MRTIRTGIGAIVLASAALTLSACDSFLEVENTNTPDRRRVLSDAADVEALIGSSFYTWWNNTHNLHPMVGLSAAADEITSSRPAFLMRMFGSQPRYEGGSGFPNDPSFAGRGHAENPWFGLYSAISIANDGLQAIDEGMEIGPDGAGTPRARAFAKFVQGLSHGMIALLFDQGFVVTEGTDLESGLLELQPYGEVMAAALTMLDEAIALAEQNSFVLEPTWINGLPLNNEQFARLARSYKARFMAGVTRTVEERRQVDWPEVIRLVDAGITEDVVLTGGGDWFHAMHAYGQRGELLRTDYLMIGPADTTGALDRWLAVDPQDREPFQIRTADRRITGAAGPRAPGTDFRFFGGAGMPTNFGGHFLSSYHHYRYRDFFDNGNTGPMVEMKTTEMDMLKAEALLWTGGSPATVAELINRTRVRRGKLPPATAATPVGGVSDRQNPNLNRGATLWSMLKHEKRIETMATAVGLAYTDDRGWNDLVRTTHLHLPVPGAELLTLQKEIYSFGGGGPGSAETDVW